MNKIEQKTITQNNNTERTFTDLLYRGNLCVHGIFFLTIQSCGACDQGTAGKSSLRDRHHVFRVASLEGICFLYFFSLLWQQNMASQQNTAITMKQSVPNPIGIQIDLLYMQEKKKKNIYLTNWKFMENYTNKLCVSVS